MYAKIFKGEVPVPEATVAEELPLKEKFFAEVLKGETSPKVVTEEMHGVFTAAGYIQKPVELEGASAENIYKDAISDGLVVYENSDNLELLSYIGGDALLLAFGVEVRKNASLFAEDIGFIGKKVVRLPSR